MMHGQKKHQISQERRSDLHHGEYLN